MTTKLLRIFESGPIKIVVERGRSIATISVPSFLQDNIDPGDIDDLIKTLLEVKELLINEASREMAEFDRQLAKQYPEAQETLL